MTTPALDPLIHDLPRLRICALLAEIASIESRKLRELTEMSDSALSKHLKRLAEAGYIKQDLGKPSGRGRPSTWVSLTTDGRNAYQLHLAALRDLVAASTASLAAPAMTQRPGQV